jgi:hypothetical protein
MKSPYDQTMVFTLPGPAAERGLVADLEALIMQGAGF